MIIGGHDRYLHGRETRMRITEKQLRSFIRESLLTEIEDEALVVAPDDRYKNLKMDPETKARVSAAATAAVEGAIDFTKSLGELALDTIIYFRTGKFLLDAISLMTPVAHAPKDEKDVQAVIGAANLHDFLDKFGTAGFEPADLINAAVYMLEKNWKMAALCGVAAVPVVGAAIKNAKLGKTSKFLINDIKALDDGIAKLEEGLRKTGDPNAELVISEVKNVRADMNGGKANFEPINERRAIAEEIAKKPEVLASASKFINDVKVDPAAVLSGTRTDARGKKLVSWFQSYESQLEMPERIFAAKKFIKDSQRLFGKIGSDVIVKPIVGTQKVVNAALERINKPFQSLGSFDERVTITSVDDAKRVIDDLNSWDAAKDTRISVEGMGPDTITVIPIANAAGKDTLPSAWMIAHALFDGGIGNFLIKDMPSTKRIVEQVEAVFRRLKEIDPDLPDIEAPDSLLGLSVNSMWGRNARELVKQSQAGADLYKLSYPAIGKEIKRGEKLPALSMNTATGFQERSFTAQQYAYRPRIDNISEILASALTKENGFVPDLSHIPADYPHRKAVEDAAKKIQSLTADIKAAFNTDAKGKVIWIVVN